MLNYQVSFGSPWYLLLCGLLPLLWWFSFRSLALLGPVRRLLAIVLRSVVLMLIILAVAEIQMVRISDKLTVIYLLDQSLSIPVEQRQAMIEYVNNEILERRKDKDRVGVIVFGRDAAIEIPPFDDDVQMAAVIESLLDDESTNLAGAIKLAQASFPEDAAKRLVVVSDGNENIGNAIEEAQRVAGTGIGIDVVPIRYRARAEVVVERLSIPSDVRPGQPFDLKAVVTNTAEEAGAASRMVRGRLVVSQLTEGQPVALSDEPVTLPPGKKVFTIRQQIDSPNFYTYEARFVPDRPEDDAMPQNNRATAFTHVRGKGQVLLIRDHQYPSNRPPEHGTLIQRLRRLGLEVTVQPTDQLFTTFAELQPYDTVVLANVPREHFTEAQIEMLVRNTEQMGAGVVMLGGRNSLGAGGWAGSELEKAMPVDFQIKNAKVEPRGALVLMMHACEIPQGNHWQKIIARESIKVLGARDYCGMIHWSGKVQWLWGRGLKQVVGPNRREMMRRVDLMTPGDMPEFDPAMKMALKGFAGVPEAAKKHMIIISDGDPSRPSGAVIQAYKDMGVTISTVAVGSHGPAESRLLANIAQNTGGVYYAVNNPRALPRIFQREARRVARPLIWDKHPVRPVVKFPHEMISGVEDPLPPIQGFVLTSRKDNPLVETLLIAPDAAGERNSTILACWTYGLGKSAVFASDSGAQWTSEWTQSEVYDKVFGQMVRWSMRPWKGSGKFTIASDVEDGQVRLVVTALDKDDEFLNFLNMTGTVVGPKLEPLPLELEQTAPGRYVGTFPGRDAGSYFVMINPGAGTIPIRTGINVPYSEEFRDRVADDALLGRLAATVPKGGVAGKVIEPSRDPQRPDPSPAENTFRHGDLLKATSSQDVWYLLVVLGCCLFFFDVFFRRVQVGLTWVPAAAGRLRDVVLRREPQPAPVEYIRRLRSRKAEVSTRIEQLRSDARFEPSTTAPADVEVLEETAPRATPSEAPSMVPEETTEQESYTERLLRAKKKVWDGRGR